MASGPGPRPLTPDPRFLSGRNLLQLVAREERVAQVLIIAGFERFKFNLLLPCTVVHRPMHARPVAADLRELVYGYAAHQLIMDRDENSAKNILMRYLARLGPHTQVS